jgi:hypothetical protein
VFEEGAWRNMIMPKGDYPSSIDGFRFLQERESRPVATCWNFQTTESFQPGSAVRLLADLPEDCELSFFDPSAKQEEAWLFVRRAGQHYFVKKVGRVSSPWVGRPLSAVVASFLASPLVQKPVGSFDSFSVSSIPEHQRYEHIN